MIIGNRAIDSRTIVGGGYEQNGKCFIFRINYVMGQNLLTEEIYSVSEKDCKRWLKQVNSCLDKYELPDAVSMRELEEEEIDEDTPQMGKIGFN